MKKTFAWLLMVILLIALPSLTGCAKTKAPAPSEKSLGDDKKSEEQGEEKKQGGAVAVKDACSLLSVVEASKAMGTELSKGSDENKGYDAVPGAETSYCGFTNNGATPDVLRAMTVTLYAFPDADIAKQTLETNKKMFGNAETVGGLADGAYWAPDAEQLFVRKGNTQLVVTIIQPESGGKEKAEAAAKVIAPRL